MEIQGVVNARNYVFRVGLPEHIHEFLRGDADADMEAGCDASAVSPRPRCSSGNGLCNTASAFGLPSPRELAL